MAPRVRHGCAVALTGALLVLTGCQGELSASQGPSGLHNADALEPWLATAGDAQQQRANVLLVGDSVLEGLGADWETRPAVLLQDNLRDAFSIGGPQGAGHLPAANFGGVAAPWDVVGASPSRSFGLGLKSLALGTGRSLTHEGSFRRLRVWFSVEPGESAPGTVSIDEAPAQPISATGDRTGSGLFWDSGDLGPGEHRVSLTGGADGVPFVLEAIEEFASKDDLEHGVHVYDGAHSGFTSRAFVADLPAVRHMWEAAGAIEPDVTVVHLGINDRTIDVSAEELADNVSEIADRAAAAAGDEDHPVLVVVPYEVPRPDLPGTRDERWDDMRDALIDLAEDNVAVVDLDVSWPDLAFGRGADTGLMLEDPTPVHPNPVGRQRIADILAEALTGG